MILYGLIVGRDISFSLVSKISLFALKDDILSKAFCSEEFATYHRVVSYRTPITMYHSYRGSIIYCRNGSPNQLLWPSRSTQGSWPSLQSHTCRVSNIVSILWSFVDVIEPLGIHQQDMAYPCHIICFLILLEILCLCHYSSWRNQDPCEMYRIWSKNNIILTVLLWIYWYT